MKKRTLGRAAAAAVGAVVALTAGAGTVQAAGENLDTGHTTTAYLVPWDTSSYSDALAQAANLTDASLFAYRTSSTGALSVVQSGAVDCSAMRKLQQAGVRVQALVSNLDPSGWNQAAAESVINNSSRRSTFVTNAVDKVIKPGCSNGFTFDGLELDFENLRSSDRSGFTATVKALASALHAKSKTLHVSVFSKASDNPAGYPTQQAQDWGAIGKTADSVRIQGYGYCWEGGGCVGGAAPGPIDPSFWVQATLKYAIRVMPAAKVTLGIPLYGIDWVRGANGTPVVWNDVVRLLNANGSAPVWNETNASGQLVQYPSYSYGNGHVISFSNQYASAARLALAKSAGISGVAFWRLGGEDPGTWTQVAAHW